MKMIKIKNNDTDVQRPMTNNQLSNQLMTNI